MSAPVIWSLGLAVGAATPLALEGTGDLLPADSAALVAVVARLANALREDAEAAPFHGLPIVVRDVWTIAHARDSLAMTLVALAIRTLNVESNPRSEVTLIVAQKDRGASDWQLRYSRRTSGPEDRVEGTDLLAALSLRDGSLALATLRESENGAIVDVLKQSGEAWSVIWSSQSRSCR